MLAFDAGHIGSNPVTPTEANMKRRTAKKQAARRLRANRRFSVHAAGCTEANCSTKWYNDAEIVAEMQDVAQGMPVSVPRSLRAILGRYL